MAICRLEPGRMQMIKWSIKLTEEDVVLWRETN